VHYKSLHSWSVTPKEAIAIQRKLAARIWLESELKDIETIAGVDVGYNETREQAVAAIVVMRFPELEIIETVTASSKIKFPYVPGLLTFREGPVILVAIKKLKSVPDVFLFDGQGIAHPRQMGIAAHLGILLDQPTIGCAKSWLYGKGTSPLEKRGKFTYLYDKTDLNKIIGAILRTRDNVQPIYVSQGYKIRLQQAIEIVLSCSPRYRVPEPIRQAHSLVEMMKNKKRYEQMH
jgi:deoxyribonuclease V